MKLYELLNSAGIQTTGIQNLDINSIHYNSQDVKPGGLFVAIKGETVDGHDFIEQAFENGALCALTHRYSDKKNVIITNQDTVKVLALLACSFYGNPSRNLCLIGITGTNGKTTTSYLIESILLQAGIKAGVIGTINFRYNGKTFDNPITTPQSLDIQKTLAQMRDAGVTHVIMEVSSHAIELNRIYGTYFDGGVFTNLTQDHLDFHQSISAYWQCKKRFFTDYLYSKANPKKAFSVINAFNEYGKELRLEIIKLNSYPITISRGPGSSIEPGEEEYGLEGTKCSINTYFSYSPYWYRSKLIGRHNLENTLCAFAVGVRLHVELVTVIEGIENLKAVPGRLERIYDQHHLERFVYIDYAHTPDALQHVLNTLKFLKQENAKLICVLGCGGDRDKTKRPLMGQIAAQLSDITIITSDNPRTEDPQKIIQDILSGIQNTKHYSISDIQNNGFTQKGCAVEPDRKKAITAALKASAPSDVVLIAGKGHETYQIIGKTKFAFDDREIAREVIKTLGE